MTHEEALNLILAHTCPEGGEDNERTFRFDLHCNEARVTAKLISTLETIQYEIVDVKIGYQQTF